MVDLTQALERIRRIGEQRGGVGRLAEAAGVPYTTVDALKKRGWSNKNLDAIVKLFEAAERIEREQAADDEAAA